MHPPYRDQSPRDQRRNELTGRKRMSDNDYALAMDMPNADTKAEEIPAYKVSQLLEMYTYYRSQALTPAEATRNTANYCRVRLATAERYCGDIG